VLAPPEERQRSPSQVNGWRDGPAIFARGLLRPFTLLSLASEPAHGYQLRQRLESAGLEPESGGLYRLLHRLERDGYVSGTSSGQGRGPGRRVYRLTARGAEQLKAESETLAHMAELLRSFSRGYRELLDAGALASSEPRLPETAIEQVGLSPRAAERLRQLGVRSLEELAMLTEWRLLRQGLWVGDVRQIVAALARSGLALREGTAGGPPRNAPGEAGAEALRAGRAEPWARGRAMSRRRRNQAIVAARQEGDTLREVGHRFGLSRERVRQILVDMDAADLALPKRARDGRRTVAVERRSDEALAAWRAGSGIQTIAATLGLSRAEVRGLIDRHATAADRAARRVALSNATRRAKPQGHSDEKLVAALRRVVDDAGHVPSSKEYGRIAKATGLPSLSTVENRFGGWNAAVRAAGLTPTRPRSRSYERRWTEANCLEALRALEAELGGFPSQHDYEQLSPRRPDLPSSATLRTRLGSWSAIALRLERDPGATGHTHAQ
jgi:DNA-binding PadR family transcriptional regulator